ncbi:MAG: glutaredoxin domain-containing protein [Pseudomonadota bacterium]
MSDHVDLFTKPDCPYCADAKTALAADGLTYREHDVTASDRTADLSIYLSGVSTVPQAFAGTTHVNGARDVVGLQAADRLEAVVAAGEGDAEPAGLSDEALRDGAEDFVLRDAIPEADGSRSTDERDWPILHMYKEFFGFWPNCFYYQYHWPEAYRQFVYCHNAGAIGGGKTVLGAPVMNALGYATSNAHGCSYCQVHSASVGEDESADYVRQIEAARKGGADEDNPFGPFEEALAELVAHAATNEVTDADFARIEETGDQARHTKLPVSANVEAAGMIAAAFGFLNVFNDLTGVKVEADWAEKAQDGAGIETGRHGSSDDRDSSNLDYDLPEGGPSLEGMMAGYGKEVVLAGGPARYARKHLGIEPSWVAEWPLPLRTLHIRFYVEVMAEAGDQLLPSELKHLMARVSHVAKGNDYLAGIEGWLAWHAAGETSRAVERICHAFDAAKDRDLPEGLFDDREVAALRLAWLSAQTPLTTPRRWVQPALDVFSPVELVHAITVCAMASMIQRFAAIARPEVEEEVRAFLDDHGLSASTLAIRYPLPEDRKASLAAE